MRFWFEDTYFINIDHSVAGVADWLGWKGIIAEIAIFESAHRTPSCTLSLGSHYLTLLRLTLTCR